jgi:hypothetical protein
MKKSPLLIVGVALCLLGYAVALLEILVFAQAHVVLIFSSLVAITVGWTLRALDTVLALRPPHSAMT